MMKKIFNRVIDIIVVSIILIGLFLVVSMWNNHRDKPPDLKFPKISVQDIDKTHQSMKPEKLDEMMKQIVIYRDHLDLYTSVMCRKITLSSDDTPEYCKSKCNMVDDMPLIQIPMRIHIQDNGDYEDSVIIERLVDHINYLKDTMKKHNDLHQSKIDENAKNCLRFN